MATESQPTDATFAAAFQQAPVGMAQVALDGTIVRVNDRLCRILRRSRETLLRLRSRDITHPDDFEADVVGAADLLAGRIGVYNTEKRYLDPDGSVIWARLTTSLVRNDAGQADCFIAVIDDSAREARLRVAQRIGRIGIAEWNVAGDRADYSEEYAALHGLSPGAGSETLETWLSRVHPDDRDAALAKSTELGEDGPTTLEYRIVRPSDGAVRWITERREVIRDAEGRAARVIGSHQDMTAQRLAETALSESEARLRLAAEAGLVGIFDWTLRTDTLRWDGRMRDMWALPDDMPVDLETFFAGLHPDDVPRIRAAIQASLDPASGGMFQAEYRVIGLTDGVERHIVARAKVSFEEGAAVRMVGTAVDISALRLAERAATASSQEARLAVERLHLALEAGAIIGTWMWEVPADRLIADERFAASFGLDPEACRTGVRLEQVSASIHPDDLPRVYDAIAEATGRGGAYVCRYRVRQRDGVYRWIEAAGRVDLAADGTPLRFPGVLLDIDDRHAMEEERDRAIALLRGFVETIPGVVYAKDRDGRMVVANAGTAALIGKRPDQFIGKTDAEFLDDPAQAALVMANDRRIMDNGVAEQVEELVSRPDGSPATWLSTKAPFRNNAGEVIGLIGTSVDISERKQVEAELERLVAERTRDLRATQERLAHAQRMEALGQLAGGIAHDFNNVIQAVQGGARLICRRPSDVDRVRSLATMIGDSAERGAGITRRLLAFSRRGDLRAEAVDAGSLLSAMQEILTHTLGAGITVRVRVDDGTPPLLADKGQLETVLINLATNARDAMDGRGMLRLSVASDHVTAERLGDYPTTLRAGSFVRLSVSDTGTGMSPQILARASEPFFTTKAAGQGTGLGLAMSRGFAEQSGGGLQIDSVPGEGTTVSLWFPVAPEDVQPMPVAPEALAQAIRSRPVRARLLIVDDEPVVRSTLAQELEEAGFSVAQVASAREALAQLGADAGVDLVVTDLSMPGMDGWALVREIKRQRPCLPAIVLTGFVPSSAELAMTREMTGALTLVQKPIAGKLLAAHVAVMLEGVSTAPTG